MSDDGRIPEGYEPPECNSAKLRDDESPDISAHAHRNIEMIREAEGNGQLDSSDAEQAVERIKERDCDE